MSPSSGGSTMLWSGSRLRYLSIFWSPNKHRKLWDILSTNPLFLNTEFWILPMLKRKIGWSHWLDVVVQKTHPPWKRCTVGDPGIRGCGGRGGRGASRPDPIFDLLVGNVALNILKNICFWGDTCVPFFQLIFCASTPNAQALSGVLGAVVCYKRGSCARGCVAWVAVLPFTDPVGDGPVIAECSTVAMAKGPPFHR